MNVFAFRRLSYRFGPIVPTGLPWRTAGAAPIATELRAGMAEDRSGMAPKIARPRQPGDASSRPSRQRCGMMAAILLALPADLEGGKPLGVGIPDFRAAEQQAFNRAPVTAERPSVLGWWVCSRKGKIAVQRAKKRP